MARSIEAIFNQGIRLGAVAGVYWENSRLRALALLMPTSLKKRDKDKLAREYADATVKMFTAVSAQDLDAAEKEMTKTYEAICNALVENLSTDKATR